MKKRKTLKERFWEKVDKTPGHGPKGNCWVWTASKSKKGYGSFDYKKAHRVAYELWKGPIPEGKLLLHSCDYPSCVKPAHLKPGTHLENSHDSIKKGRHYSKLTKEIVIRIRKLRTIGLSGNQIAGLFEVSPSSVYRILSGKSWSHLATKEGAA